MDHRIRTATTFEDIAAERYSRREVLRAIGATGVMAAATSLLPTFVRLAFATTSLSSLTFTEITRSRSINASVAPGYTIQLLLRWGDRVLADAPLFDAALQTPESQALQFGYNNDFLAYFPFARGSADSDHGLLFVNHEYTDARLMVPGNHYADDEGGHSRREVDIEMAAHGNSIVEIRKSENRWEPVIGSPYNRRITANSPIRISGPAAGHERLKTSYDPTGKKAYGTLGNCAGGITPWGTALSAEENFNGFFSGATFPAAEARNHKRYGVGTRPFYNWHNHYGRFDAEKEPREPNRFGWVVEHDPYDPTSTPVKRTALGRFKHEGADTTLTRDGRLAVYMGDDEKFEYLYRFVTAEKVGSGSHEKLLDSGTLYAAKFSADGTMQWLPLIFGTGPLTHANDFHSQADVLIETRRAADLLGATPMDRPEGVKVNPINGKIYAVMTKNADRDDARTNPANPRAKNIHGHIIELTPPTGDHGATTFRWDMFIEGGNPAHPEDRAMYHGTPSDQGWISCPDNIALDPEGRIWIATDGQPTSIGYSDSLYAADTSGPGYGVTRLFFNGPTGCEITGPCFTPDGKTLFLSIQHPAEDPGSSYDTPSTRWPDFKDDTPPRPSVLAIVKDDGGNIGD